MTNVDSSALELLVDQIAREAVARRRIPGATYRLQMNEAFNFRDAQRIVPYLHALGISDCYLSPIFKARQGSTHGYDICDYTQLNDNLGSEEDFEALVATLHDHGMGLMLDIVPNHMGVGQRCNRWWIDVLENGPSSIYAPFFDIDWHPVKPELANRVLLPVLEDQYGAVLESGKLKLAYEDGTFIIAYWEMKLPVTPDSYSLILSASVEDLIESLGADDEHVQELQSILTALSYLPPYTETDPQRVAERNREKEIIKRRIAALVEASPAIHDAIEATITTLNGTPGDPASFDTLEMLLKQQPYRPAFWRVATDEINYRRFFDINDMAAIHVELPEVFEEVHTLPMRLLAAGQINSLRIDHPDGLWDPTAYFRQLQESYLIGVVRARLAEQGDEIGDEAIVEAVRQWCAQSCDPDNPERQPWPVYVVAEKILSETEPLPLDWAVYGTTGYDFLNAVNGLYVNSQNRALFDRIYSDFLNATLRFDRLVYEAKHMIMADALSSEIRALSHRLERITEDSRRYRDFTLSGITDAIRETIASLSIYRTYITGPEQISARDRQYILEAVLDARRRNPGTSRLIFSFVRDTLLLNNLDSFSESAQGDVLNFVMKFQQLTGPVMAKSVEDTTFYVYNRLVSLNEVGGHPEQFGITVETFHTQNQARAERWPNAMLASSTHDTKRSEDVRARINVLSEMPADWAKAIYRWQQLNAPHKVLVEGELVPDRNEEYLLYQTLLGTWPLGDLGTDEMETYRGRIATYVLKAANEAKTHTSWINPDEEYSAALQDFVHRMLDTNQANPFLEAFLPFQRRIAYYGQFNALAQTLLKLTSPGQPDIYQGNELWDFSLVDPDNRRPVDYDQRRAYLDDLRSQAGQVNGDRLALARALLQSSQDGRIKLYVTAQTLDFRRDHELLFNEGDYRPLDATGSRRDHVCAFARTYTDEAVLVVTPCLIVGLTSGQERPPTGADLWGETQLSLPADLAGTYRNLFTGEILTAEAGESASLPLARALASFPVALLQQV